MFKSICVYAGSSSGNKALYAEEAAKLGRHLAEQGIRMVYGGGKVGLMGTVANAVLSHGGEVTGVIPQHLVDLEVAHDALTELRVVADMHVRKFTMASLSDAFIALPGGIGTAEELLEILTWLQLGIHNKPVGLLDTEGYYSSLLVFLRHMVDERFLRAEHLGMLCVAPSVEELMEKLRSFSAPRTAKWLE